MNRDEKTIILITEKLIDILLFFFEFIALVLISKIKPFDTFCCTLTFPKFCILLYFTYRFICGYFYNFFKKIRKLK